MRYDSIPFLCAAALAVLLGGCETAPNPDYRVKVVDDPSGKGTIALPPECLNWHDYETGSAFENVLSPTFGCATARNLAAQVERPEDLIESKPMGAPDPVVSAAAISRYQAGKTTPLIDPNATKPSQVIKMEDARMGGGALQK